MKSQLRLWLIIQLKIIDGINNLNINTDGKLEEVKPNECKKHKGIKYYGDTCLLCKIEKMNGASENARNSTLRFGEFNDERFNVADRPK